MKFARNRTQIVTNFRHSKLLKCSIPKAIYYIIISNIVGENVVISKKNSEMFEKHNFLQNRDHIQNDWGC